LSSPFHKYTRLSPTQQISYSFSCRRIAAMVVPIGNASALRLECRMISSSARCTACASGAPAVTSRTIASRAIALATSPCSWPPMPSATSHRPSSASA
jgi:hypothetical protein